MVPALATFFKSTVDENLTKVLQPAGLVPAAIFVLLNLAFVYPTAQKKGLEAAQRFEALDENWQVVVIAVLILVLGYLLLSAANNVIDMLAGETWRGSLLYAAGANLQHRQYESLRARAKGLDDRSAERLALCWQLETAFPAETQSVAERRIAPTALGNALLASQEIIHARHGIDPVALWPQMAGTLTEESPGGRGAEDNKASLDVLANLTFIFAAFAVEAVVFYGLLANWRGVLLGALGAPAAYVAYRAAVTKARAWGDAMEVVFDLNLASLRGKLGLRKPTTVAEARVDWREATERFLWRASAEKTDHIYEEKTSPMTIRCSRNVDVQVADAQIRVDVAGLRDPPTAARVGEYVSYHVIVSRVDDADVTAEADVSIADSRVPHVGRPPTPAERRPHVVVELADGGEDGVDVVAWHIGELRPRASRRFRYELPIWELIVTPSESTLDVSGSLDGDGLEVSITNKTDRPITDATLEVFVATHALTQLAIEGVEDRFTWSPGTNDHRYQTELGSLDPGAPVRFILKSEGGTQ